VRIEELEAICQEAARQLVEREERPLPAAVVLPLPDKTRVTTFPGFPDDDEVRLVLLERFADDVMRPENAPCYGFVAEATVAAGDDALDVVVVAYGASRHHPRLTAATIEDQDLGDFSEPEELDPAAMPFLAPLQHAVEGAQPPDATAPVFPSGPS
jgi:hypothetical protein